MINIINDNCLNYMEKMNDKSVDVIVTSPPYNIGIKYSKYHDKRSDIDYLEVMNDVAQIWKRILSDDGSIFLNLGSKPSNQKSVFKTMNIFLEYFELQNVIHWVKSIHIDEQNKTYGHFKPINSSFYLNDCAEYIFHLTKTGKVSIDRKSIGVPYTDKSNITRWNHDLSNFDYDLRCRGNCWHIPYPTTKSRIKDRPHPASFPLSLPYMCMKLHGVDKIKMALDPFLGIGTSALAAKKLKINFTGIDIDPIYCEEAIKRVNDSENK